VVCHDFACIPLIFGRFIFLHFPETEQPTEAVSKGLVDDVAVKAKTTSEDALEMVRYNAGVFIDKLRSLSESPDEVEINFGLKTTSEAGGTFVIAKGGLEANYNVKLVWKWSEGK
jgi:hypothetical protein